MTILTRFSSHGQRVPTFHLFVVNISEQELIVLFLRYIFLFVMIYYIFSYMFFMYYNLSYIIMCL